MQTKDINSAQLYSVLFIFITIYLTSEVIIRSQGILMARVIPSFKENIKNFLVDIIFNKDYRFFIDTMSGTLMQKVQDFTSSSERVLQIIIYNFFTIIVSLLITASLLFYIMPIYSFLIVIWFYVHFVSTSVRFNQTIKYIKDYHSIHSNTSGDLIEVLSKIATVKIYNGELHEIKRARRNFSLEKRSLQKSQIYFEKIKIFQSMLSISLIIILISHQIYGLMNDRFKAGDLIFVTFISYNLINYVWYSSFQFTVFMRELGVLKNSFDTLLKSSLTTYADKKKPSNRVISSCPTLEIINLNFSHRQAGIIIKNLSLNISFGEKVIIKGQSGTGKTTLARLLVGLHSGYTGNILIGGVNIKDIPREELRKLVVLVEQNVSLFNRTIKENICYNNLNYTNEQLFKSLHLSCCDEFINNLPNGVETKIGDGGIILSGGQAQRIAIARSILACPKLLILDESTTGLEKDLKIKLIKNILSIKNQTLLVISHSPEVQALIKRHIFMHEKTHSQYNLAREAVC